MRILNSLACIQKSLTLSELPFSSFRFFSALSFALCEHIWENWSATGMVFIIFMAFLLVSLQLSKRKGSNNHWKKGSVVWDFFGKASSQSEGSSMIWSSATGFGSTFALARLFSNSPMERRPSSVLFWNNSQCISTCWDVSISVLAMLSVKMKVERKNPFIRLSYALWMCFKKRTAATAPPQRCFGGVLVSRFVTWKKWQLQWT